MKAERIEARIENYTNNLTNAVQSGNGAQFSMLLSMISTNQEAYRPEQQRSTEFSLPEPEVDLYPTNDELNTPEVVDRLNHSINDALLGDYAYLVSHLHTEALTPRSAKRAADNFAKVSLMSAGSLMLEEINTSRQQINVGA